MLVLPAEGPQAPHGIFRLGLATGPLIGVINAAEAIGCGRGLPAVIALYTSWIAFQPLNTRELPAGWFNLGTELAVAGDVPGPRRAYRMALAINPGFAPALNLGLQLERDGDKRPSANPALETGPGASDPISVSSGRCRCRNWTLCDDFVILPEIAAAYQPTPLAIEGLYQANDSKRVVGAPITRQQAGLP